jgi:hypothetical protein
MAIEQLFTKEESDRWISERRVVLSPTAMNELLAKLGVDPSSEQGQSLKERYATKTLKEAEVILARQVAANTRTGPVAVMKPVYMTPGTCCICGSAVDLLKCSVCRSVHYCGKEHQKQDWKRHKHECKPYPR